MIITVTVDVSDDDGGLYSKYVGYQKQLLPNRTGY